MGIIFFIGIAVLIMLLLMLTRRKKYSISVSKSLIILIFVAVFGMWATRFLYFIENGGWAGRSFFGAVLFLPLLMLPLAKLLSIPYNLITDFISLPGLSMFAIMKYNCYVQDCCGGIVIGYTPENSPIFFPSQLVEVFVTIVIIIVLLIFEHRGKTFGKLYPLSMIVYGIIRFILNWLRWDNSSRILGMPKGNFWAILCAVIGLIWIIWIHYFKNREIDIQQTKEAD